MIVDGSGSFGAWEKKIGFGLRVRQVIEKKYTSAQRIADLAKINLRHFYRLLSGEKQPTWDVACRIADALQVNVAELRYDAPELRCEGCGRPVTP